MAESNIRKILAARSISGNNPDERFRVIATVKRFGSRRGWQGRDEPTVLLVDLFDAATSSKLCDHLWFKAGKWTEGLRIGDQIGFDARITSYEKGYRDCREVDWRLGWPTKVEKLTEQQVAEIEASAFAEAFK